MKYAMTTLLLALVLATGCSVQPSKPPLKPKPAEKKQEFVIKDTKWLDDLGFSDARIREALASHDTPGMPIEKIAVSEAKRVTKKFSEDKTAKPWIIINVSNYDPYKIRDNNLWKALGFRPLYLVGYEGAKGTNSLYVAMKQKNSGESYATGLGKQPFAEGVGASLILLDKYFGHSDWSYQVLQDTAWVIGNDGVKTAGIFLGPLSYIGGMDYYAKQKGIVAGRIYEGDELTKTVLEADNLTDHTY